MPERTETILQRRFGAMLRLYVAVTPTMGEAMWAASQRFEALPDELKQPGHWYRPGHLRGLIEVTTDGSGEWHPESRVPDGVDPAGVVGLPDDVPISTLRESLAAMLSQVGPTAHGSTEARTAQTEIEAMATFAASERLCEAFMQEAKEMPAGWDELETYLHRSLQASFQRYARGEVCGYDVMGLLLVWALLRVVATKSKETAATLLQTSGSLPRMTIAAVSAQVLEACWRGHFEEQVVAALDELRGRGDEVVREAQVLGYPEHHPELAMDVYYGALTQAIPYLLCAEEGYHKLARAPGLATEERLRYERRAGTAEEKLVRVMTAMLYAVQDADLSHLRRQQAVADALAESAPEKVQAFVYELIQLKFFYPPRFKEVLLPRIRDGV